MVDWSTCPAQDSPARDAWLLSHIQAGEGEATLQEITVEANGHLGRFYVFAEPLKLGGVRINASAALQQQIADALGCVFLTPRLADLVFANRSVTLPPMPRPITSSTAAMIEQSDKVGAAVPPGASGIVDTEGKYWVLVKSLFSASAKAARKAANYGWHFEGSSFQGLKGEPTVSLPGVRVIQGVGTVHNDQHTDYSQIVRLVSRTCEVDGQQRDLADVLMDPDLAPLVSHEGPLPGWRQPDVTEAPPTTTVTPGGGEETPTTTAPASSGGSSLARKAAGGVALFSALFLLGRALARLLGDLCWTGAIPASVVNDGYKTNKLFVQQGEVSVGFRIQPSGFLQAALIRALCKLILPTAPREKAFQAPLTGREGESNCLNSCREPGPPTAYDGNRHFYRRRTGPFGVVVSNKIRPSKRAGSEDILSHDQEKTRATLQISQDGSVRVDASGGAAVVLVGIAAFGAGWYLKTKYDEAQRQAQAQHDDLAREMEVLDQQIRLQQERVDRELRLWQEQEERRLLAQKAYRAALGA